MTDELRKKLFQAFDPQEPLAPADKRYVDYGNVRGDTELLNQMEDTIRLSSGRRCQLFSGHRGCGKTTELLVLKERLQRGDALKPRRFVVYCEADQYTNLDDVEYTDVLLAVVQQLWTDARQIGVALNSGKFQAMMQDVKTIPRSPKDAEFNLWIAKFKFELKNDTDYRRLVRESLRPRSKTLTEAINEILESAKTALHSKGYAGVCVIVDNLDRMLEYTIKDTNRTSHEELFLFGGDHLRDLACDVIYTVPPALYYAKYGALSERYATDPQILPMIPVALRSGGVDDTGLEKLRETIRKRVDFAGATLEAVFDSEQTLDRLCAASGGYVRSLLTFAQSAVTRTGRLPVTADAVNQTIRKIRDGYTRSIPETRLWDVLRETARTKTINRNQAGFHLLSNFLVFEYCDMAGSWYDINPVLREAWEFQP